MDDPPNRRGRSGLDEATKELVARLAKENPRWGYVRIKGELAKLGRVVSVTSIRDILRGAGSARPPEATGPAGWSSSEPRPPTHWRVTSSA